MERNVGGADRTARIVAGLSLAVVSMATVAWGGGLSPPVRLAVSGGALLVGAILLATAGAESCPINSALGRNTYRGDRRL